MLNTQTCTLAHFLRKLNLLLKLQVKTARHTLPRSVLFCLLCLNSKSISKEETVITHSPGAITHATLCLVPRARCEPKT